MQRIHSLTAAIALAVATTGASAAFAQTPPQQQQTRPQGQPTRPQDQQAAKPGMASSDDQAFVQKAAVSGQMEVQQGKMAASKASNAQVRAFGNMLVKDHTAANQQLMAIAKRKKIAMGDHDRMVNNQASPAGGSATSATSDTKAGATRTSTSQTTGTTGASGGVATTGEARDRQAMPQQTEAWMSATGNAFDRGFVEAQVKAHQEAIALFEKQANGGDDSDLKAFAQKQLPGLRNHLKQAQDLQAKLPSTE